MPNYRLLGQALGSNGGTFSIATNGDVTFDPGNDFQSLVTGATATTTLTYTITDTGGLTDTATITVTVSGDNDPITAITLDSTNIDENIMFDTMTGTGEQAGAVVGTVSLSTLDTGGTYTYQVLENDPTQFNWFEMNGNQLVVKNDTDLNHEIREFHDVTVQVTDSEGDTFTQTFTIQVNDLNEAPQNFVVTVEGEIDGNLEAVNAASSIDANPAPDIVGLSDGGYVQIFTAMRGEGGGEGRFVMAQRFDSRSEPVGSPTQLSTSEVPWGSEPDATTLSDGSIVVSYVTVAADGSKDVAFQRFDSAWSPVGGEMMANNVTAGDQTNVSVQALTGGGFVMAWENPATGGVSSRVYDATGAPIAAQNDFASAASPQLAALAGGGYVMAYAASDGDGNGVFGQIYDALGAVVGVPLALNQTTAGEQSNVQIVTRANGEVSVVWNETRADGSSAIMYRHFDDAGSPLGGERELTSNATNELVLDDIVALQDQGFFISYTEVTDAATGQGDVLGWRFNPIGVPVTQAAINSEAIGSNSHSSIQELSNGDIVLAWESHKNSATGNERSVERIHRNFIGSSTASGNIARDGMHTYALSEGGDFTPEVVGLADGGYLSFWRSQGVDGDGWALQGQAFDVDGNATGAAFTVNTSATGDQGYPAAAQLGNGGVVLAFESDGDIVVQRFTSAGALLGTNAVINTTTAGVQEAPAVTALDGGGYVVTWRDETGGIMAQAYDGEGFADGGEVSLSATAVAQEGNISVAGVTGNEYVAVWENAAGDIIGRRFASDGTPQGAEFTVNTTTAGQQTSPSVAGLGDGGFIVTWASEAGEDGDGGSIVAQRYQADGTPSGPEFVINTSGANTQSHPEILGLADGGFIVVWESEHRTDNQSEVWGQRFNPDGSLREGEFQVSLDTINGAGTERQGLPAAAQLVNGNIVFAWHSEDSQATATDGVKVRLFEQMPSEDDVGPVLVATLSSDDIDEGENHTYTLVNDPSGKFEVIGNQVFLRNGESFDNLARFTQDFDITVRVTDKGGLTLEDTVTLTINGGRDAPTNIFLDDGDAFGATDDDSGGTVADGATGGTIVGTLSATDVDLDVAQVTALGYAASEGDTHTFTIIEDDPQEYHLFEIVNGNEIAIKAGFELVASERATHLVKVRVTDSQGLEYEEVITINVDRPNVAPTQINLSPNGDFVQQGSVQVTDHFSSASSRSVRATIVELGNTPGEDGDYWLIGTSVDAAHDENWYAQRYDEDGNIQGSRVILSHPNSEYGDATRLDNGNIAIVYYQSGRNAIAVYDSADFSEIVAPIIVPDASASTDYAMSIESIGNGKFVIQWSGENGGAFGRDSYISIFNNDGTAATDAMGNPIDPIQVNQFTAGNQGWNNGDSIIPTDDGGFIVIYRAQGTDGDSYGISGRKYDQFGTPQGNEFVINDDTAGFQDYPDSIRLTGGNILVTWYGNGAGDTSSYGIYAKIIDQNGNDVVSQFTVNSTISSAQYYPDAIRLNDGGFIITWNTPGPIDRRFDTYAQRFDANGNKLGPEFIVFDDPGQQSNVRQGSEQLANGDVVFIASDDTGAGVSKVIFDISDPNTPVVAHDPADTFSDWIDFHYRLDAAVLADGTIVSVHANGDVYTQKTQSDGTILETTNRFEDFSSDTQGGVKIEALEDGGYIVVWASHDRQGADPSRYAVRMQRFDALGNELGEQYVVNTTTEEIQYYPDIGALSDGGWVVTWTDTSGADGSGYGVFMQRFDTDGKRVGGETLVNDLTAGHQEHSDVVGLADGGFIVTWENASGEIAAKQYDAIGNVIVAEFQVNTNTVYTQNYPDTAALAGGGYVIAWFDRGNGVDNGNDGDVGAVHVRVFDASGNPVVNTDNGNSDQILVNTTTVGWQQYQSVVALQDGGFIVAFEHADDRADLIQVRAQRFDATGNKVGTEMIVVDDAGNNFFPEVVEGPNGEVTFVYYSHGEAGGHEIRSTTWQPGVAETVAAGSVVAHLSTEDINNETGETFTYELLTAIGGTVIANDGQFEIVGSTIRLMAGQTLDYETDTSHTFAIRVTDSGGNQYEQEVTFDVIDVAAAPVGIDLNGDGQVAFDSIEEGIQFDIDGDGQLEQTAWASEEDGVLVYDHDENGLVDGAEEVEFTRYVEGAETDLEGLNFFDTDEDGTLDADDEAFAKFKIWQDADGDGVVDEGELSTLSEHGIESIGLTSDGATYRDGDVLVHGEAEVRYEDGSTGTAADAEFDYIEQALDETDDESLIVNQNDGVEQDLHEEEPVAQDQAEVADARPDYGEGGHSPTAVIDEQAQIDAQMS